MNFQYHRSCFFQSSLVLQFSDNPHVIHMLFPLLFQYHSNFLIGPSNLVIAKMGVGLYVSVCTLLPSNQSFYRQITSQEKGGAVSGVGQW